MTKSPAKGDCYEVAANFLLDNPLDTDTKLCHGTAFGRGGDAKGKRYGHAWIEIAQGNVVLDYSNGNNAAVYAPRYYEIGQIKDVVRYTLKEARQMLCDHEHYGPWPTTTEVNT